MGTLHRDFWVFFKVWTFPIFCMCFCLFFHFLVFHGFRFFENVGNKVFKSTFATLPMQGKLVCLSLFSAQKVRAHNPIYFSFVCASFTVLDAPKLTEEIKKLHCIIFNYPLCLLCLFYSQSINPIAP